MDRCREMRKQYDAVLEMVKVTFPEADAEVLKEAAAEARRLLNHHSEILHTKIERIVNTAERSGNKIMNEDFDRAFLDNVVYALTPEPDADADLLVELFVLGLGAGSRTWRTTLAEHVFDRGQEVLERWI